MKPGAMHAGGLFGFVDCGPVRLSSFSLTDASLFLTFCAHLFGRNVGGSCAESFITLPADAAVVPERSWPCPIVKRTRNLPHSTTAFAFARTHLDLDLGLDFR